MSLSIPKHQTRGHQGSPVDIDYEKIKTWIKELSLLNAEKTLPQLLPALADINQAELSNALRYRILELLRPAVRNLTVAMRKHYQTAPLPLTAKNKMRAANTKLLLQEVAYGYKLLVNQLGASGEAHPQIDVALSLYHAISSLGQLMLETYIGYERLPPGIWNELNGHYKIAQSLGIQKTPMETVGGNERTIEQAYTQLLLLAAINPYRLMHGEAVKIHTQMESWSRYCQLTTAPKTSRPANVLIIPLSGDEAPYHAPPSMEFDPACDIRVLNVDRLKAAIQRQLEKTDHQGKQRLATSLAERLKRNMLLRLVDGWKSKNERKTPRIGCTTNIELITGLNSSFLLFGGDRLAKKERESVPATPSLSLSLVPREEDMDELESAIWANQKQGAGSASNFAVDDPGDDVWDEKLVRLQAEEEEGPSFNIYSLIQTDHSSGGLSVNFELLSGLQLRVGDLVCYREEHDAASSWKLGTIRWLEFSFGSGNFGVMNLAEKAAAITVKSLLGAGKGGDQFPGLLIGASAFEAPEARVLVPASIYDIGTVLFVEARESTLQLQLKEVHEFSESYTCFSFTVIDE